MTSSVVAKQAESFRKRVAKMNDGACMYAHHALEKMEEILALHAKIEASAQRLHVVFVDEDSGVAVAEERRGNKSNDVLYFAVTREAPDKWHRSSNCWDSIPLAYMDGVAHKQIGLNNQFALFAGRMLKLEPIN